MTGLLGLGESDEISPYSPDQTVPPQKMIRTRFDLRRKYLKESNMSTPYLPLGQTPTFQTP
jgi:hypothetical protein